MPIDLQARIAVAGAGSIGCYVGACLAAAGRNVRLLARGGLAESCAKHGLRFSSLEGDDKALSPEAVSLSADPAAVFEGADVVLVTVKCRDTETIAALLAQHAPKDCVVVSLQNGVNNASILREKLGGNRHVLAGTVTFNVVQSGKEGEPRQYHRASTGRLLIEAGASGLLQLLSVPGLSVQERSDIEPILWAKLLLNLNNALNALSGLPLAQELADRRWRLLLRGQIEEALAVLRAGRIKVGSIEGVHPRVTVQALGLPNALFKLAARKMLSIDPAARSSMWEDLEAGRPTEIDQIQGEIVALAKKFQLGVPLNERVLHLIKQAEQARQGSPHLVPSAVA